MKLRIRFLCFLLVLFSGGNSQELIFPYSNQSLINLNPSFAGSNGGIRNQTTYYNKWPNLSSRVEIYNSAFDAYIKPIRGGIALSYFTKGFSAISLKKTQLNLIYAQHILIQKIKLKAIPSFQVSYLQNNLDIQSLHFGDPIDPEFNKIWDVRAGVLPYTRRSNLDFSSGLLLNYNNIYAGIAVKHLTQPDMGLFGVNKLPASYNFHASWGKKYNNKTMMQLLALYVKQGNFQYVNLSANTVLIKHLVLGATYFSNNFKDNNITFNAGARTNLFSIVIGYHFSGNLTSNTTGSWVLTFSYNLRNAELRRELVPFENW